MTKTALFFAAGALVAASAFAAASAPEERGLTAVMRAMFLAQSGAHSQAAEMFSELAESLRDPGLMQEAYREALNARDSAAAVRHVRRWRELGGGAPSLQAAARLFLLLGSGKEAAPALAELKTGGAENELLFQILVAGRKEDVLPLERDLLDDSADGNFFRAKLAAHFGEWTAAESAVARGLSQAEKNSSRLTEMHFARIRIAADRAGDFAAAAPLIDDYVADGCPGDGVICREAEAIYAFSLFSEGRKEWKTAPAENAADAMLAAGHFFERAKLDARARPYYEEVRGRYFYADLGLARIVRREGNLEEALAALDAASVANDGEFALRETTAAEIARELRGIRAGLARIVRAREISPDNHDLIYAHSLLAEEVGDVPSAVALLEHLTNLFPDSAEGWNALGYVLADHNLRLGEAEKFIKKALSIDGDSANILDSLGWVYYRQGRLPEALQYLRRAAQMLKSAAILAHLGEVHWQLGEYAQARKAFDKGREYDSEDKVLNETLRRLRIIN